MRQVALLVWKEWREVRWVVGFALVMFVAIPLIAGIEGRRYTHGVKFEPSPWVMFLGGLLATVLAATSVCRDLDGKLSDFWQSRAVRPRRWLGVKFFVGLAVVQICCLAPMAIEEWLDPGDYVHSVHFAAILCAWLPLVIAVQFGFGFVSGALTRRAGPAILLALAMTLLAYTLPLVLPPLRSLNLTELLERSSSTHPPATTVIPWVPWRVPFAPREQLPFLFTAILLTATALGLGVIAVVRDWEIRAAQKLTYWSIAAAILLVFASAAFQLATNLPVLQTTEVGDHDDVAAISSDGKQGIAFYRAEVNQNGNYSGAGAQPFDLSANEVRRRPAVRMTSWPVGEANQAWLSAHPDYCFLLRQESEPTIANIERVKLGVFNLARPASPLVTTLDLGTTDPTIFHGSARVYPVGDQLYIEWWADVKTCKAVVVDVQNPEQPKVTPSEPFPVKLFGSALPHTLQFDLVPVSDLSLRERLEASVLIGGIGFAALSGDLLATCSGEGLSIYRLGGFKESREPRPKTIAEFNLIGQYRPSMLESALGNWQMNLSANHGLLYLTEASNGFGRSLWRVTVFDLSDPAHPRPVGHFAAPEEGARPLVTCPLPDGRLLAGGRKLYLLGPPPGW